jgi:hypothetical protein
MAYDGRARPDTTFKDAAQSPISGEMEPTIVTLERSGFSGLCGRRGHVELGADTLTIHHPKLNRPLELPLGDIAHVIAGPAPEVCRPTTIPAGLRSRATLVLVLAEPRKIWLSGSPGRTVAEIALAAADPVQATIALSRLRVAPPAPPTEQQRRRAGPVWLGLRVVVPALVVGGLTAASHLAIDGHAAARPNPRVEAAKTEGRSLLPAVPTVAGATAYRPATAPDGSRVFVWQRGDKLRVRVDAAPRDCDGVTWREWWKTADRGGIAIGAGGAFQQTRSKRQDLAAGGIDTITTTIDGSVHDRRVDLHFVRRDDYRSASGDGSCRFELSVGGLRQP